MDIKQFDIVLVDFGEGVGSEQSRRRPAVVIQNNVGNKYSPTTLVMPLTSQYKKVSQPTHTILGKGGSNNLSMNSVVLGEAMRQISEQRIICYIGHVASQLEQQAIRRVYAANIGM